MSTSTAAETPDLPTTQRAWLVVRQGDPAEALKLEEKAPVPRLEKGDVLVKVQAAALNPVYVLRPESITYFTYDYCTLAVVIR